MTFNPVPPTEEHMHNAYEAGRIAGSLDAGRLLNRERSKTARTFFSGFFCALGFVGLGHYFGMFLRAWP